MSEVKGCLSTFLLGHMYGLNLIPEHMKVLLMQRIL